MTNKDVIIAQLLRYNEQQAEQIRLLTEENQQLRERIVRLEKKLLETDSFSVAFEPQYNTYNGRTNLQFVLNDIQFE